MVISANPVSRYGRVIQLGFVPQDFDAALKFWTQQMGVGPFFLLEGLRFEGSLYKGGVIDVEASVAHGFWGDLHIELIRQHNTDVPSAYLDPEEPRRDGLHHVLLETDDAAALQAACLENGGKVAMACSMPGAGDFTYIDMGDAGPLVELSTLAPRFQKLFRYMRAEASRWDGSDPIRSVPDESVWSAVDDE